MPLVAIEPLVEEASRRWGGRAVGRIDVYRPGDANALVELTVSDATQITFHREKIIFDGTNGEVVSEVDNTEWAAETNGVMYGLHIGRFADPLVRFLYFVSSVVGTAMIATGLILWVAKRASKRPGSVQLGFGHRLVECLNVGTIVGLPIAMAAFFWSNRILPADLGPRADFEALAFFIAWILAYVHAAVRPKARAWVEQLLFAAFLYGALPVLNGLTTQSHLGRSLPQGDWVRAGFDLTALVSGVLLAWVACYVWRKHRNAANPAKFPVGAETPLQGAQEQRG